MMTVDSIDIDYDLPALGTKVLVTQVGKSAKQGEWWPREQMRPLRPSRLPVLVRIASV